MTVRALETSQRIRLPQLRLSKTTKTPKICSLYMLS